jgi:putative transposase
MTLCAGWRLIAFQVATTKSSRRVIMSKSSHTASIVGITKQILDELVTEGVSEYLDKRCLEFIQDVINMEVESLCGPRYQHDQTRQHTRHGSQAGVVTALQGGKQTITKPRVRNVLTEAETVLQTYMAFRDNKLLDEHCVALIDAGVPTRQLKNTIRKSLRKRGISANAVSQRIIKNAELAYKHFSERRWDGTRFVALLLDGVRYGNCMVIACVGIDLSGRKHVLGVHPGGSEQELVCTKFLRQLIDRGLNPDGNYLFVVDGSKGLRNAIHNCFGPGAVIQRCQQHKVEDVAAHLPPKERDYFRAKLHAAYNTRSYTKASAKLQEIRVKLGRYEQAKNSLTEGLEDTLTLHKLGIWGGLKDCLRTTNVIESTFSTLRKKTRNVTNWQNEDQINRWTAQGLLLVEKGYKRVPGYRTLTLLKSKLDAHYFALHSLKP